MDDISDIRQYYDETYDEDSRLDRHQLERDLTWRYLDAFLPSTGHVLEIGAASGGYTVGLAQRGYSITVSILCMNQLVLRPSFWPP
jgi:S-adenosylmethionine-dependent methyltransferase